MKRISPRSAKKPVLALPYIPESLSQPSRRHRQTQAQPGEQGRQRLRRMILWPFGPAAEQPQAEKRADIEDAAQRNGEDQFEYASGRRLAIGPDDQEPVDAGAH